MRSFFGANAYTAQTFPSFQEFEFEGLAGRLRSSTYVPTMDHANFAPMMDELGRIFAAHQQHGRVRVEYSTRVYFGHLHSNRPLS